MLCAVCVCVCVCARARVCGCVCVCVCVAVHSSISMRADCVVYVQEELAKERSKHQRYVQKKTQEIRELVEEVRPTLFGCCYNY